MAGCPGRSTKIALSTLALVAFCSSQAALAAQVTFRAEGTTTWTENGDGLIAAALGWIPPNGTPISYTFTFETSAADQEAGDPTFGRYSALTSATLQIGPTIVPVTLTFKDINVWNDRGSFVWDAYLLITGFFPYNGYSVIPDLQLISEGSVAQPSMAFLTDSLPLTPPDLAKFSNKTMKLQVNQSSTSNVFDFVLGVINTVVVVPTDDDGDGVNNDVDNCISAANPDQTDTDLDGQGDACDNDDDGDGVADSNDNCQFTPNADQSDQDADGIGNVCDVDPDGDGVSGAADNCPLVPNSDQTDTDDDSLGDDCDTDDDNDAVCDLDASAPDCSAGPDNCPTIHNTNQDDLEGDGIGDACDADLDGDGVANQADNCPVDGNIDQNDTDGDGAGDVCDADLDDDQVGNTGDNCPYLANPDQADLDQDGQGDACDADVDGDGIATGADNCPATPNSDQLDFDGDSSGDACDIDVDGDQVSDAADQCELTAIGAVVDPQNGCSLAQLCPCAGPAGTTVPWKNHGKYVSCVAHVANEFADSDLISETVKDDIVSAAAESSCGN
jgi:hypothetical protein